jgi:tRNA(Ile)-lysidine synthase
MTTSSLHRSVARALVEAGIPAPGEPTLIVAALSGGPDSVALVDVLATLGSQRGFEVMAAHFDHGLRPDSAQDRAFCEDLCRRLGIPLRSGTGDVRGQARDEGEGIEQAGRRQRYAFLRAVQASLGAGAIAVGHTGDDQAETLLLHLLRGSGRPGLSGMRLFRDGVLRPMLRSSRSAVVDHLRRRGLEWLEDPSNRDLGFARNRVRHELLPYLEGRFNPRVRSRLVDLAEILAGEEDLLDELTEAGKTRAVACDREGVTVSRTALRGLPLPLARRVVRAALEEAGGVRGVRARHVSRILDLSRHPQASGRRLPLPGNREARVRFDGISIGRRRPMPGGFALALPVPGRVTTPTGQTFAARPWSRHEPAPAEGAVVSREGLGELEVRTRRPGDRVRFHGREVSLRRFLMDGRVPFDLRDALSIVAMGPRVLWVPGLPHESDPRAEQLVHLAVHAADEEAMA